MDTSCACLKRDMSPGDDFGFPVNKRMAAYDPFQFLAGPCPRHYFVFCKAEFFHAWFYQFLSQYQISRRGLYNLIHELGMQGYRQIRRKGPWRCRPYDKVSPFYRIDRKFPLRVFYRELYKDRGGGFIRIFYLCLGKGRLTGGTPEHRLFSFVDAALLDNFSELPDDRGLIRMGHRQIGRLPIPEYPKPFELLTLDIDILFRIFPAELPDLKLAH